MSEFRSVRPELLSPATAASVYLRLRDWQENPIGGDARIAMLGEALSGLIEDHEPFRNSVTESLEARQDPDNFFHHNIINHPASRNIGSEFAANLVRTAVQYNLLCVTSANGKQFPKDFQTAEDLKAEIASWYEHEPKSFEDFTPRDYLEINIVRRFIATNYFKRAVGAKLAAYVYGQEFPKEIRAIDIGCSQNEVLAQLMMNMPFENFNILDADPRSGLIIPDERLSNDVNNHMLGALPFRYGLGVDIHNPKDVDNINWAWSSRRPSELMDRALLNRDYQLTTFTQPNFGFRRADFSNSAEARLTYAPNHTIAFEGRPNVALIFTMMYELPPETVGEILANAAEAVSEDGVVLIQEPVDIDPSAPSGLRFYDDFRIPGVYKLIAWWPHQPNRGLETVAIYDSARCHNAFLNRELIRPR